LWDWVRFAKRFDPEICVTLAATRLGRAGDREICVTQRLANAGRHLEICVTRSAASGCRG
jgi:hypothetical protein